MLSIYLLIRLSYVFLGLISTCLSFSWIMLILYLFNMSIAYYLIDNALLYWNSLQSSNLIHICNCKSGTILVLLDPWYLHFDDLGSTSSPIVV
jgi:hypothetical protein